ncbi:MAG: tetratricopeptide repeat protein [Croceibacterium sp.]
MISNANSKRMMGLAVTSAMAAGLLTGCATHPAPRADLSASRAEAAMAKGKPQLAVEHAEAAVLAEPRNASYRAMLASAYLDAGRFASAESTFNDAMKLGDNSTRTALSLALALDGQGKYQQAAALLSDWESQIAPADLGLAYALSAKPDRGVEVLSNAIRNGENTPKMRQNLAYAYALAGRWKEARIMASQDVPANQVGDRMEEWAQMAQPTAWQTRVAALIGAPAGVADAGQPAQLALANNPGVEQLATEATAAASPATALAANDTPVATPQPAAHEELPPVGDAAPQLAVANYPAPKTAEPSDFQAAFASVAPAGGSIAQVTQDAMRFVSQPAVQTAAVRHGAAPRYASAAKQSAGSHLVQLGSFASAQGARRAWGIYSKRYPELSNHQMVISEAVVGGKHYWRVSAAGFGLASSQAMCGRVKSSGEGCFAYAEGRPLPGAIDTGTRLAFR